MPQNEFNGFNDFIKIFNDYIGSFNSETSNKSDDSNSQESDEECNNCRFGNSNANATKSQREACSDIPGRVSRYSTTAFISNWRVVRKCYGR